MGIFDSVQKSRVRWLKWHRKNGKRRNIKKNLGLEMDVFNIWVESSKRSPSRIVSLQILKWIYNWEKWVTNKEYDLLDWRYSAIAKAKETPSMLDVLVKMRKKIMKNRPSSKLIDDDKRSLSHILNNVSNFLLNSMGGKSKHQLSFRLGKCSDYFLCHRQFRSVIVNSDKIWNSNPWEYSITNWNYRLTTWNETTNLSKNNRKCCLKILENIRI